MSYQEQTPPKSRKYTPDDKAKFFAEFDRVGSTTAAAKTLGFNADTCAQWVYKAGLTSRRLGNPRHEEYMRLRKNGATRGDAASTVGIHPRTAKDWDRGVKKAHNGRIYPDGRVVDYTRGVSITTTPTGETTSTAYRPVAIAKLEKPISARYLSLREREIIRDMSAAGSSLRTIAAALGRAPSTISREITRNSTVIHGYQPYSAQRSAVARRRRPKTRKLLTVVRLHRYVQDKLLLRWSPEQISKTLIKDFPDDQEMRVSVETVYQTLYLQGRGSLRREVTAALRTRRARRKPHQTGEQRRSRFVDPMIMISERPPEVEDRAVPGHWEGDLITGAYNQSAIGTLVERASRYVMLVHLPIDHTAFAVRDGLIETMRTLPEHLRGSLTWDQGAEMAEHRAFSIATDMDVYFCDPPAPGNEVRTRTRMGYCGNISRREPICPSTDGKTSNAQLSSSTPAHEKRSAGIPQPSACVIYY